KILPHDKLIILGSEEKIDLFRKNTEFTPQTKKEPKPENDLLGNFGLKSVPLDAENPLIGKKISESRIREDGESLIVGIERHGTRILNPSSDTILEIGDILLIAGEIDSLDHLEENHAQKNGQ